MKASEIVERCARHFETSAELITNSRRTTALSIARHALMFELRKRTVLSLSEIGRIIGNRDHTTVLHGIRRHEQRLAEQRSGNDRWTHVDLEPFAENHADDPGRSVTG